MRQFITVKFNRILRANIIWLSVIIFLICIIAFKDLLVFNKFLLYKSAKALYWVRNTHLTRTAHALAANEVAAWLVGKDGI